MDPAFLNARVLPDRRADRTCILGLRLYPLTLGHLFLLLEYRSPFALPEKPLRIEDLFLAIFICSHPWRKSERHLRAFWLRGFFKIWAAHVAVRRTDWERELARFRDWLKQQLGAPATKPPEGVDNSRPLGAPLPYIRLVFLTQRIGLNLDEALDTSISLANALFATWAEFEGKAELAYGPTSAALWDFARQQDAARFNPDGSRKAEPSPVQKTTDHE